MVVRKASHLSLNHGEINLCKLNAFIVWLPYFEDENGRGEQAILCEIVEPDLLINPK
jgi:hypothetical protein